MHSSSLVEVFFRLLSSIRILLFEWRKMGNMKISEVRTRVVEWRGETVPPQPHTCTNPVDLLDLPSDAMRYFFSQFLSPGPLALPVRGGNFNSL
jgi:hypothetical protein